MHIGKQHNKITCSELSVDSWKEKVTKDKNGFKIIVDHYTGKEVMESVNEKAYLGDIISKDGTNTKNIKSRTDKAYGNIDKIISTLQ